ncbi:MAG: hypothetical protein KKG92_06150 [Gammaproteobacteria bacterium]|nr:hypothetical protein [Gammaproteobacteria bacterium]
MQLTLDIFANSPPPASLSALAAVEVLASQGNVEARGAVFTRREVVDFILDLAGYTPDQKRRLGKAKRAQRTAAMLGTLRFAQPTALRHCVAELNSARH